MTAENTQRVYSYLVNYGRLGAHPYQLVKALNLSKDNVMLALASLQREGKVRLRSSNIEWIAGRLKRSQTVQPSLDAKSEPEGSGLPKSNQPTGS